MMTIKEALLKYWGYEYFRPQQEEIILNVLKGHPTLALLPTGGGKSICFQVPGLVLQGITIVISPLIALMKDQVYQLQNRGIAADAIFSGMTKKAIDITLDNCIYGQTKFLYISPERLKTDIFKERLKKMNVALLAIDEAHCISQWGYDFRPSYLEISEILPLIPNARVIALTASATLQVAKDILDKLKIPSANIFKKSFARANLHYACIQTENKLDELTYWLKRIPGTSVVYVRSRKRTKEISDFLNNSGLSASYYHAGLSQELRSKIQEKWIGDSVKIIVATNAFGMGIDKSNVRTVFHLDLPESLEAYYQEAGRAGRDEKDAFALVLYGNADLRNLLTQTDQRFPDRESMIKVYNAIGNYFQMAVGSGFMQSFELSISKISSEYNIQALLIFNTIKELEKHGWFQMNDSANYQSLIHFLVDNKELYRYQIKNPKSDAFIKAIIRGYGGDIFTSYVKIDEDKIAKLSQLDHNKVIDTLQLLKTQNIIDYVPKSGNPSLTFLIPRQDTKRHFISHKDLERDRSRYLQRVQSMLDYVTKQKICRSNILQTYFGETNILACGKCDNCKRNSKLESSQSSLKDNILILISQYKSIKLDALANINFDVDKQQVISVIREMLRDETIQIDEKDLISLK